MRIGANYLGNGLCEFMVWAPFLNKLSVDIIGPGKKRRPAVDLEQIEFGYWKGVANDSPPGSLYSLALDGALKRSDPASHFQPFGVNGPSELVDHEYPWDDALWRGLGLAEMIIYEIHAGAFTPEGTFEAIIPRLEELKDIGVNAIELMPVAQFPGDRNWGYDGVFPFSVQNSYGGPMGLKRLVNECHGRGIAVILDTVYNHLGPEGNYLHDFGPYFTDTYKTPWGRAMNFDGPYSDEVRNYFIENAIHWFRNYHIDALRLDAIHAIFDFSAIPFLKILKERVANFGRASGRDFYLIAESDLNDPKVLKDPGAGGYGLDAGWCDDFHHSVHALITGEREGYYADFGDTRHLVKSLREGFVYSGQYSGYRKKSFGSPSASIPGGRFIVFSQNHDQTGNRMMGERLSQLVSFDALKLACGIMLLSPYIPLLFMGEEYGEDAPFLYFTSHSGEGLIEAAAKGRLEEFREFKWRGTPPAPNSPETFLKSKINWGRRSSSGNKVLLEFHKALINLRKTTPALSNPDRGCLEASGDHERRIVFLKRWNGVSTVFCVFNVSSAANDISLQMPEGRWKKAFDSCALKWNGAGETMPSVVNMRADCRLSGFGFALYIKEVA
ncbi:MAG: malto-oligosyltrehalose trehalohydrolase [Deltaproteobacteria bacterium]|nr:malto-oligosyltrehalose trehalohydrolase [Deltaproteobacteria bacterium]